MGYCMPSIAIGGSAGLEGGWRDVWEGVSSMGEGVSSRNFKVEKSIASIAIGCCSFPRRLSRPLRSKADPSAMSTLLSAWSRPTVRLAA